MTGTASVDDQFDDCWKENIEKKVTEYSDMSSSRERLEIKMWLKSLESNDGLVGELFKYGGKECIIC